MYWPLPTTPQKSLSPGARFAAVRPWGSKSPTRYHVGVDLVAEEGTLVLAPEDGVIVERDRGWQGPTARALLFHGKTYSWLLGCINGASSRPDGTAVRAGEGLCAVGHYVKTDGSPSSMLHVTAFWGALSPAQVNARQQWRVDEPIPEGLVDPWPLLQGATSPGLPPGDNFGGIVVHTKDGAYSSTRPCPAVGEVLACGVGQIAAWTEALEHYIAAADAALAAAGTERPVDTARAGELLEGPRAVLVAAASGQLPGDRVAALVRACQVAEGARRMATGFPGGAPAPDYPSGQIVPAAAANTGDGGGALLVAGSLALGALGVVAAAARRRRR